MCVVTGAASGIGRAVVESLASRGERVAAVVRTGSSRPWDASVEVVEADLASTASVDVALDRLVALAASVPLLVHAAGVAEFPEPSELTAARLREHLAVNLEAVVRLTLGLRQQLRSASSASVVTMSSEQVRAPSPVNLAYGSSKAALEHATRSLAAALGVDGIRVNGLSLGWIDTPLLRGLVDLDHVPANALGRTGTPSEVVDAIDFLRAAPHATGAILELDGGANL